MGQHQGGPLDLLDDLGHGEGLARAGDPQQSLLGQPQLHALGQGLNGLRLVAGGLIRGDNVKIGHAVPTSFPAPDPVPGPAFNGASYIYSISYQNICSKSRGDRKNPSMLRPSVWVRIPVQQAAILQGDHVVLGKDQVVGQLHPHLPQHPGERFSGEQVGVGGEGQA